MARALRHEPDVFLCGSGRAAVGYPALVVLCACFHPDLQVSRAKSRAHLHANMPFHLTVSISLVVVLVTCDLGVRRCAGNVWFGCQYVPRPLPQPHTAIYPGDGGGCPLRSRRTCYWFCGPGAPGKHPWAPAPSIPGGFFCCYITGEAFITKQPPCPRQPT